MSQSVSILLLAALLSTTALAQEPAVIEPQTIAPAQSEPQEPASAPPAENKTDTVEAAVENEPQNPSPVEPKSRAATGKAAEPLIKKLQRNAAQNQSDYAIAKVNDDTIMNSELLEIWKNLFQGQAETPPPIDSFGPAVRDNIVRGLISERLMLKEAERIGLDERPDVKQKLAALRRQLLVQTLLAEREADLLTDANVKKEYENIVRETAGKEEIRARHILVKTQEEAEKWLEEIKGGADFAKIAKEHSLDKGSTVKGGDLGYFNDKQMVPEFSAAAFNLDKDELSEPVETSFGWHIIEVTDRRPLPIPTLAEARPDIEKKLAAESSEQYVKQLLKDAKIEYYDAEGKPRPLPLDEQNMQLEPSSGDEAAPQDAAQ
jgi:peptidyl-prolyl cis-trans isomerase C